MNDYTQPMTDAEREARRLWLAERNRLWCVQYNQVDFNKDQLQKPYQSPEWIAAFANATPDPVEFDWPALNREFSEGG